MSYKDSPYLIEIFDFDLLHLELNTALFIVALVLVVMLLLNHLLFRPVMRSLENRAHLMDSLEKEADRQREEISKLSEHYEARLADVRAEVARVRAEAGRETQTEVNAILERAREEAQADFQAAMDDLRQQTELAKRELGQASQRLAEQTTNRILQA